jgi:hypothetical protein
LVCCRKATYGSDGGTTLSEHAQSRDNGLNSRNAVGELLNVAGEFLTQSQRGSILQVGSTDLDNVFERLSLGLHGVVELVQGRKKRCVDFSNGGNVHGRREAVQINVSLWLVSRVSDSRVVGTLGHVDVVVGVNGLLAAQFSAQHFDSSVRDNLVNVHVGLGARTGLEDDQGEVVDELARDDLVSGVADGLDDLGIETWNRNAQNSIGYRCEFHNIDIP